ncbi:MAG: threonylcarbamoyl-AMP synthase [Oscillospiraceae bacterium]|jgi:L-threonylcarbamoyladenylate synthase|nr:threonylcarbamoyl-AMP synthase [Oscillospiraceae bacterium]
MNTLVIGPGGNLSRAAETIRRGGLVAVPTETVYGLCCDGSNESAVDRLFETKGRPEGKPISLLVSGALQAERSCGYMTPAARKLAEAFWPGPVTLVIDRRPGTSDRLAAGGDTIGVRCPGNTLALRLAYMSGRPLAAPSCNPSGAPSAVDADMALGYFGGAIECVIDGGKCRIGVESTVVSVTRDGIRILRAGAIPEEAIWRAI